MSDHPLMPGHDPDHDSGRDTSRDTGRDTGLTRQARPHRLQEYQAMLARKLLDARAQPAVERYLGLQVGECWWLLALADAGEVLELRTPSPVPMTQSWYLGLVNVRGSLLGIVDLLQFTRGTATPTSSMSKIVALAGQAEQACGIVVSRILGLKNPAGMQAQAEDSSQGAWQARAWRDEEGREWRVLDVKSLLGEPRFLQAGRHTQ